MFNGDPYDNGTPKYNTPLEIYDALQEMANGEEINILGQMFTDISWEGQDYYYTDSASDLVEKWDRVTGYCDKMWLMDAAAWQLEDEMDVNNVLPQIVFNEDFGKRIGFRKIFIDTVLGGFSSKYKAVIGAFEDALYNLDRYDFVTNQNVLLTALSAAGCAVRISPYPELCSAVYDKLKGLRLDTEKQLIIESRAMLTSYDDFMFGLRSNQALYNQQKAIYEDRVAELQSKYDNAVKLLLAAAQEQGVVLRLPEVPLQLIEINKEENHG